MQRKPETGLPDGQQSAAKGYAVDWEKSMFMWKDRAEKARNMVSVWQGVGAVVSCLSLLAGYALGAWLGWP